MTQTKAELLQTRHQGDIRLGDADSSHYVGFKAPATVGSSLVWTLPAADGTANYLLKTDGSGNLSWTADNSGIALSGSTNNTIVTVNGVNAIAGEANLTYDGTNLQGKQTGNSGQELIFDSNRSAANNQLGGIAGYGDTDRVADIWFQSGADTTNKDDGYITFRTSISQGSIAEAMRIDSSRRVLIGTTTEGNTAADDLTVYKNGDAGITVRSGTSNSGNLFFSDGTSGGDEYRGYLQYQHSSNKLSIGTNATTALTIDSSGRLLIGTTTEGHTSGDNLTIEDSGDCGITIRSGTSNAGLIYFSDGTSGADEYRGFVQYSHGSSNNLYLGSNGVTALTLDSSQNATLTSAIYGPVKTVSALELDLSTGNYFIKTISGNSTFTFANPAASGTVTAFTLELTHSSGTVTWPSSVKWNADTAPTLTTGKTHLFMFVTDDGGSRYRGSALVDYVN